MEGIVKFAKEKKVELVIVGPEDPLAEGVVDALEAAGIKAFGPIEGGGAVGGGQGVFKTDNAVKLGIDGGGADVHEVCGRQGVYSEQG